MKENRNYAFMKSVGTIAILIVFVILGYNMLKKPKESPLPPVCNWWLGA